jgi:hypothetical protein
MSYEPWAPTGAAREALRRIVADFGAPALSNPQIMENCLDDQMPDGPEKEKTILVAAAKAGVAATLQEHVAQGMDHDHAVRLTASWFAGKAPFEAAACGWVTGQLARALGYQVNDAQGALAAGAETVLPQQAVPYQQPGQVPPGQVPPGQVPPGWSAGGTAQPAPATGALLPTAPYQPQVTYGAPTQAPPGWGAPPGMPQAVAGGGAGGRARGGNGKVVTVALAVIVIAYLISAANGHFPPFSKTAVHRTTVSSRVTTSPTTTGTNPGTTGTNPGTTGTSPGTTGTGGGTTPTSAVASGPLDLQSNIPAYITSNGSCENEGPSSFASTNATEETLCQLKSIDVAESYALYLQFQGKSAAENYYESVLSGNGMQEGEGDCSTLGEVSTSTDDAEYCEDQYSGKYSGHVFVYEGDPRFQFGDKYEVECLNDPSAVAMVGFSDGSNYVVGMAWACNDSANSAHDILSDFHDNLLDVGSTKAG